MGLRKRWQAMKNDSFSDAKWIWTPHQNPRGYNLAAVFEREFEASGSRPCSLLITADSQFRAYLNGVWVGDGPARAYPEFYLYETFDLAPFLRSGRNTLRVLVRHHGVGTFHRLPCQAGLLAEISCGDTRIPTDANWRSKPHETLLSATPKVSVQMEPVEMLDDRLRSRFRWEPAQEHFTAKQSPWKKLAPNPTSHLTRTPQAPRGLVHAMFLKPAADHVCVPVTRIAHPHLVEANLRTSRPVLLTSRLTVRKEFSLDPADSRWRVAINGRLLDKMESLAVEAGNYAVVFFCDDFQGHRKEADFPFLHARGAKWGDWSVFVREEFLFAENDMVWPWFKVPALDKLELGWRASMPATAALWSDSSTPIPDLGLRVDWPLEDLFLPDIGADFAARIPAGNAMARLSNPGAVCAKGGKTTIIPARNGHPVELCFDLGVQRVGFIDFSLEAPEGTMVDIHLVEHITADGRVQHTEGNRNGLRFITRAGRTSWTSLKRRSGRFVFLTLKNHRAPVNLHHLQIIESTAPVQPAAHFESSDAALDSVWDAAERTLSLCTEDVFTDCPLYEQTLWIGDARNEALYSLAIHGAADVSARCLVLGAQSLSRFPMVGCQVPSGWECLLPAWSFLWAMQVWEHYEHTGDKRLLRSLWPAVCRNLEGAIARLNSMGLFEATAWNLLEWAPMDQQHPVVLHNSLLLAGALRAAIDCAKALGHPAEEKALSKTRKRLISDVNSWLDDATYPDAIYENGHSSPKRCLQNTALAVMCGVMPKTSLARAREILLSPPADLTQPGSPFACQFLYEALDLLGCQEEIIAHIRRAYGPMIKAGASTVWETFPESECSPQTFPTRSHCHGWSCAPLLYFNRIILGIRPTACGGKSYIISPRPCGLEKASGAEATPHGPLRVAWTIQNGKMHLEIDAPRGINVKFVPNSNLPGIADKIIS